MTYSLGLDPSWISNRFSCLTKDGWSAKYVTKNQHVKCLRMTLFKIYSGIKQENQFIEDNPFSTGHHPDITHNTLFSDRPLSKIAKIQLIKLWFCVVYEEVQSTVRNTYIQ